MSTRVGGKLEHQDFADTYLIWCKPGQCRYGLTVRGEGAVRLLIESSDMDGEMGTRLPTGWRAIEDRAIPAGSRVANFVTIPEVELAPSTKAPWVQVRVRIARLDPSPSVEYDFFLDGGA